MRILCLFIIALIPYSIYGSCSSCKRSSPIYLPYDPANPTRSFSSALKKEKISFDDEIEEEGDGQGNGLAKTNDEVEREAGSQVNEVVKAESSVEKDVADNGDQKVHAYSRSDFYQECEPRKEDSFEEFSTFEQLEDLSQFTNEKIKWNIEKKLYGAWFATNYDKVKVEVRNGTVTLTGVVDRESQLADINKRVWPVLGVVKVINKIYAKNLNAKFSSGS